TRASRQATHATSPTEPNQPSTHDHSDGVSRLSRALRLRVWRRSAATNDLLQYFPRVGLEVLLMKRDYLRRWPPAIERHCHVVRLDGGSRAPRRREHDGPR